MTEHVPTIATPKSKPRLRRLEPGGRLHSQALTLAALAIGTASLGCETEPVAVVHLSVGARPDEHRSFQPKSSIAEYTELPGLGAELRVVLSSHPITCESYLPLHSDQVMVTLTFSTTLGTTLGPGAYPWPGQKAEAPNGGERPSAQVLPSIRLGKLNRELPPGGHVELTEVKLDAQGAVRGLLRLEQPGSAGLPATSLLGSFAARWCRISTSTGNEYP